jgi:hypothetical protein
MTENQWESALERIKSHPEEVQAIYESDYTSALGSPINVRLAFDEIALGESIYKIDYGLEFLSHNFDAFVNHRTPTIDEVKSLLKKSLEGSHGLLAKKLDSIHKFDHGPTISPILTAAICSRDAATIKTTFDSFPEYSCCLNLMDYTIERLGGFPRFPHALIYILHHGLRIKLQGLDDLDDAASRKKIAIVLDFYLSPGRKVKRTKLYYNIFCRLIMRGYTDLCRYSDIIEGTYAVAVQSGNNFFAVFVIPICPDLVKSKHGLRAIKSATFFKRPDYLSVMLGIAVPEEEQYNYRNELDAEMMTALSALFFMPVIHDMEFYQHFYNGLDCIFEPAIECFKICEGKFPGFGIRLFFDLLKPYVGSCPVDDHGPIKLLSVEGIIRIASVHQIDHSIRNDEGECQLGNLLKNFSAQSKNMKYDNSEMRKVVHLLVHGKCNTKNIMSEPHVLDDNSERDLLLHQACRHGLPWHAGTDIICSAFPDGLLIGSKENGLKPFALAAESNFADLDLVFNLIRSAPSTLY